MSFANGLQKRAPLFPHVKDDGAPVILTASCSVQSGGGVTPNTAALINQTGLMLELHEVRFNFFAASQGLSGAALGVQLTLGPESITNGFVPVSLFNRSVGLFQAEEPQQYLGASTPTESAYTAGCDYHWKLDTPLLIPPGIALVPQFQHRGLIQPTITARITYCCRITKRKLGKSIIMPYVAFWATPATTIAPFWNNTQPSTYTVDYSSTEQDLVNNTLTEVNIKRLIGRMASYGTGGTRINALQSNYSDENFTFLDAITYARLTTSQGHYLCRDYLLFRSIFSRVTRELPCQITLPPSGYIIADVEMRNNNVVQTSVGGSFAPQVGMQMISMIGERKVTL